METLETYKIDDLFKEIDQMKNELKRYKDLEQDQNFEAKIIDLLYQLQIPSNNKGFELIIEAVKKIYVERNYQTTMIYHDLAKQTNDTAARVERAIRHAKEVGWARSENGFTLLNKHMKGNPSNSEFLAMLVNYLRMNK